MHEFLLQSHHALGCLRSPVSCRYCRGAMMSYFLDLLLGEVRLELEENDVIDCHFSWR